MEPRRNKIQLTQFSQRRTNSKTCEEGFQRNLNELIHNLHALRPKFDTQMVNSFFKLFLLKPPANFPWSVQFEYVNTSHRKKPE